MNGISKNQFNFFTSPPLGGAVKAVFLPHLLTSYNNLKFLKIFYLRKFWIFTPDCIKCPKFT